MTCRIFAALTVLLVLGFCVGFEAKADRFVEAKNVVSVQLTPEFHPEVEFRIAEALKRPPIEWSVARDHTFAEKSEPIQQKQVAAEMISQWESLLANPIHADFQDSINAHLRSIIKSEFAAQKRGETLQTSPVALTDVELGIEQEIPWDDLPQVNTGEEVMTPIAIEESEFPLDPYGYDEYNNYFEPEIYDWFVFVTDDLTVVYVYENSDVLPSKIDPAMLAEQNAQPVVPESFQVFVREKFRSIASGEITLRDLVVTIQQHWAAVMQPISIASLKKTELLPVHRVSQLQDLLRF
ncbi:hypothetical protein Pan97_36290 [Bremerella volcania]|uniref:Uncharacterized protein n=1 Tax=Bremerella volcania TaxID=2527984 RepID=A0A518CBH9_9BACT|nr:hypothetical protein [Bremerella volcania]QDU76577.1 hypothetical protein Pan97_36290 [Bremerella volcania]